MQSSPTYLSSMSLVVRSMQSTLSIEPPSTFINTMIRHTKSLRVLRHGSKSCMVHHHATTQSRGRLVPRSFKPTPLFVAA